MAGQDHDPDNLPTEKPDPTCNSGYAETKPRSKEQAQIPGAKQPPDAEDGGLEHDPDPES